MQIIKDTSLAWPGDFSVQDAQNIFLQPYKSKAYLFLPHLRLLNNLILVMHLLFSLEMSIYNGTPFTSTAPLKNQNKPEYEAGATGTTTSTYRRDFQI